MQKKEIDTWIDKTNEVLCELSRDVVTKWELSTTSNFQFFNRCHILG